MFGLDPLNQTVALTEILVLLALAAFVGWLLGRSVRAGRVNALRTSMASKEAELAECRQQKMGGQSPKFVVSDTEVAKSPPPFVHADPLLPALSIDDTPELIDVDEAPANASVPPVPVIERSFVSPPITSESAGVSDNSEMAVLDRIAARAGEVNFDRIGRATASEADDLKDIVGVGPFLERKLHSLGIYTFRQIANFTREDANKVNELIEFFHGRIERDNWIDQARKLHERKAR